MAEDRTRVPKLRSTPKPEVLRTLPLTPVDGFVLSRIDGFTSEVEISHATGLDAAAVEGALDKLELLGLITFPAPPTVPPTSAAQPVTATAPSDAVTAADEAELELEPELREKINAIYAKLGRADHYALLGVPRTADKKAIKRAYYEMATIYHPDRFFRKRLGNYKPMMEAIFAAMTQAQDVLGSKAGRAEYDAYLGDRAQTEEIEESVNASPPPPPPVQASVPPRSSVPVIIAPGPLDAQARRDALARKLLGGRASVPPAKMSSVPPSKDPDALRRHFESRLGDSRDKPARQHAAEAEEALKTGDAAAAITAYKMALSFSPGDPTVLAALEDIKKRADDVLAESYRRQAQYEEKSDNWIGASKSWARLAKAQVNDSEAHDRGAKAMVKCNGNLHEAGNLAQRAILLDPKKAEYRVTLANVYIAAGLLRNAKRELEAAQQLSPQDATIAALMKRVSTAG